MGSASRMICFMLLGIIFFKISDIMLTSMMELRIMFGGCLHADINIARMKLSEFE